MYIVSSSVGEYLFGYGLCITHWQAQNAWLININARADNACLLTPFATGPQNATIILTNETAPAKGTNSNVEMGLVLALHSDVMVRKIASLKERMNITAVSSRRLVWFIISVISGFELFRLYTFVLSFDTV